MGPSVREVPIKQKECINKTLSFHRMSKTNVFTIDSSRLIPRKNPRTKGLNLQLANFNRSFTNSEGKSHVKGHSTSTSPAPAPHHQALAFLNDTQIVLRWQHGMRWQNWRITMILRSQGKNGIEVSIPLSLPHLIMSYPIISQFQLQTQTSLPCSNLMAASSLDRKRLDSTSSKSR